MANWSQPRMVDKMGCQVKAECKTCLKRQMIQRQAGFLFFVIIAPYLADRGIKVGDCSLVLFITRTSPSFGYISCMKSR